VAARGVDAFVPDRAWPRLLTRFTFAVYVLHVIVWRVAGMLCGFQVDDIGDWALRVVWVGLGWLSAGGNGRWDGH